MNDDTNQNEDSVQGSTAVFPGSPRRPLDTGKFATGIKLALISFLILCFLIPLGMLSGLTEERRERSEEARFETAESWSGPLTVMTPVLSVPVTYTYLNEKNQRAFGRRQVVVYPEDIALEGTVVPELRKRGIFTVPLFSYSGAISGTFLLPALGEFGKDAVRAHWDEAAIALPFTDFQCLSEPANVVWNGQTIAFDAAKPDMDLDGAVLAARIGSEEWKSASFSVSLSLKGSDTIRFSPAAKSSSVRVRSSWNSPSFFGSVLPDERTIAKDGMSASWKAVRFGLGPTTLARNGESGDMAYSLSPDGSEFGFRLFRAMSVYQMTDRSLKYGMLFIIVPFLALFLYESLRNARIHAVQYLFLGMANCVFFLLLLALSEHIPFAASYAAAAGSVIALCSFYSAWILPKRSEGWIMALILTVLYGYLFVALQSEDYALLLGSVGLMAVLAATMLATRKVDWYRLGKRPERKT